MEYMINCAKKKTSRNVMLEILSLIVSVVFCHIYKKRTKWSSFPRGCSAKKQETNQAKMNCKRLKLFRLLIVHVYV